MKVKFLFVIVLFGLIITGCSSSTPGPLEITIEMNEYSYSPENLELQVGQEVILHLINLGSLDHEIMFGREVLSESGTPDGYHMDLFDAAGVVPEVNVEAEPHDDDDKHTEENEDEGDEHANEEQGQEHSHSGFMILVPAGHDEYTMKFTVTEEMIGTWEIGCFLDDGIHYTAGMAGTLTVVP